MTEILTPLIENVFSKALHIRHGAVMGVSEIIIGLSGNSVVHRQQVLEKAIKESGEHSVSVKLHPDVTATLKLEVKVHVAGADAE